MAGGTLAVLVAIVWGSTVMLGDRTPDDNDTYPASTGRPLTPWRPTSDPAGGGSGRDNPAAADRPVVLFEGPVTVDSGLGIDVDEASPTHTGPKSSALDMYWSRKNGLSANDGSLYIDQGMPEGAAQRCAARVEAGREGYPALDVFPGDQFCLRTSDGRIAWLRVGEGAGRADELALQVTVWDGVPG
ncbi:hypothetical protein KIH74_07995 [Kineosporia sp. J2-2]|uniref:Serine/threonine protein kinase n=1 Tax=Kineosporia corallincola TaxID=2835133 RepID=A0ABS5TDE2_9ACTN|nr:hypothetical protein [Kineosporia corallincola]MBT0768863.1 hypothetical protein [Kineosporia corallincola]